MSANEGITDDNACYSLEGAEYGVFWDEACTEPTGAVLVTNAEGYAEIGNVAVGTYWVKETRASQGYQLDETSGNGHGAHKVVVTAGCQARVNGAGGGTVAETPQNDPVNVLVQKVDKETGKNVALGGGTLAKARFTVRYYDTTDAWSLSKDYATRVATAKRTWVYETADDGRIYPHWQDPVSGDEVFRDSFGDVTFPVGTYVIEETEPSEGYLLPNNQGRTYIEVIMPDDNSKKESIDTFGEIIYKPIDPETITLVSGKQMVCEGLGWNSWKIKGEE